MRRAFAAAGILLLSVNCATVVNKRHQKIPVNSSPSGARVSLQDCGASRLDANAVTPTVVSIKRNVKGCRLVLSKDGYDDAVLQFTRHVSGWVWGNVAIGGILGWAIDAMTGAMYGQNPDNLQITLAEKKNHS